MFTLSLFLIDYEEIVSDMDTNMDAMSSTLLHMRQQLTDSHRQITSLSEENARLKALCQSTATPLTTPNGTAHTDLSSIVSTTPANNIKSSQKRPHPSNRTTQNLITTEKLKATTSLYDVEETPSSSPPTLSSNEMMEIESNPLTSTSTNSTNNNRNNLNNNNNNNQHIKRTNLLENGINVTP